MSEVEVVNASTFYGIGTDAMVRGPTFGQCSRGLDLDTAVDKPSKEWHVASFSSAVGVMEVMTDQNPCKYWETTLETKPSYSTRPENRKAEAAICINGANASMSVDTVIKVRDMVGSEFCIGFRDGNRIFEAIRDSISHGKHAVISFESIRSLSAAFLESAIGQLYKGEIPEAKLEECLTWEGVSPGRKLLIERAIAEAKESKVVP